MAVFSNMGNTVIKINDDIVSDLAEGDCITADLPNEIVTIKRGKNGNVMIAQNQTGYQSDVTIRTIAGGDADKLLGTLTSTYKNDPSKFTLVRLSITQHIGDDQGNMGIIITNLTAGVVSKMPQVKDNPEGDISQNVAVWSLKFGNYERYKS